MFLRGVLRSPLPDNLSRIPRPAEAELAFLHRWNTALLLPKSNCALTISSRVPVEMFSNIAKQQEDVNNAVDEKEDAASGVYQGKRLRQSMATSSIA